MRVKAMNGPESLDSRQLTVQEVSSYDHTKQGASKYWMWESTGSSNRRPQSVASRRKWYLMWPSKDELDLEKETGRRE